MRRLAIIAAVALATAAPARAEFISGSTLLQRIEASERIQRDALAALLQRARTALADMDRACDRDLIDAIDALDGAKGK